MCVDVYLPTHSSETLALQDASLAKDRPLVLCIIGVICGQQTLENPNGYYSTVSDHVTDELYITSAHPIVTGGLRHFVSSLGEPCYSGLNVKSEIPVGDGPFDYPEPRRPAYHNVQSILKEHWKHHNCGYEKLVAMRQNILASRPKKMFPQVKTRELRESEQQEAHVGRHLAPFNEGLMGAEEIASRTFHGWKLLHESTGGRC